MTLLTRLQTSKTDSYVHLFAKFILYFTAVNVDGLTPDQLITTVEGIQPQYVFLTFLPHRN